MEIDGGRMLEELVLFPRRRDDVGMAMSDADRDDPAERIEITAAGFIPDILHFALHNGERPFVVEKNSRIEELLALAQNLVRRGSSVGLRLMSEGRQ